MVSFYCLCVFFYWESLSYPSSSTIFLTPPPPFPVFNLYTSQPSWVRNFLIFCFNSVFSFLVFSLMTPLCFFYFVLKIYLFHSADRAGPSRFKSRSCHVIVPCSHGQGWEQSGGWGAFESPSSSLSPIDCIEPGGTTIHRGTCIPTILIHTSAVGGFGCISRAKRSLMMIYDVIR